MKQDGIRKLYYSISEVATATDLEPHVLRYWETEFEQLRPKKNRAGNRVYTDADIATLNRIKRLLKEDKYTIEGARQILSKLENPDEDFVLEGSLRELRAFLANLLQRV